MKYFIKICCMLTLFSVCCSETSAQTDQWRTHHRGNKAFRSKQYDKAGAYYRSAVQQDSLDARAHYNLGDVYITQQQPEEALKEFDKCIEREQNPLVKSMAYHNKGFVYQSMAVNAQQDKQQLLKSAIEEYKQALRLNPLDNDTRYNLALCQRQLKNEQQSQQQQQQKQQQQKKEEEKKDEQQQQDQKQQQQDPQKSDPQTEQLLNLARQAEQRAKEKINAARPRRKSLLKNW